VTSVDQALRVAQLIGYPVLVRPSGARRGGRRERAGCAWLAPGARRPGAAPWQATERRRAAVGPPTSYPRVHPAHSASPKGAARREARATYCSRSRRFPQRLAGGANPGWWGERSSPHHPYLPRPSPGLVRPNALTAEAGGPLRFAQACTRGVGGGGPLVPGFTTGYS
jgi:hypothetical protein